MYLDVAASWSLLSLDVKKKIMIDFKSNTYAYEPYAKDLSVSKQYLRESRDSKANLIK